MPTHKQDRLIWKLHLRNFLFLGAPFVGVLLLAMYAHRHGRMDWLIAALVVAFAIALVGLIRQERLFRQYRCPDCGDRLGNPPRKPGERIEYLCSRCDVIWETGFSEESD
jgi:hypothetical protein